jgi:hypothetical protein
MTEGAIPIVRIVVLNRQFNSKLIDYQTWPILNGLQSQSMIMTINYDHPLITAPLHIALQEGGLAGGSSRVKMTWVSGWASWTLKGNIATLPVRLAKWLLRWGPQPHCDVTMVTTWLTTVIMTVLQDFLCNFCYNFIHLQISLVKEFHIQYINI